MVCVWFDTGTIHKPYTNHTQTPEKTLLKSEERISGILLA
jgi:hypothetical protein